MEESIGGRGGEMMSQISSDVYGVGLISAGPGTR